MYTQIEALDESFLMTSSFAAVVTKKFFVTCCYLLQADEPQPAKGLLKGSDDANHHFMQKHQSRNIKQSLGPSAGKWPQPPCCLWPRASDQRVG